LTSGYKLIKELGKKGLRGYYFTYEQYRELAKIKEFDDVKSKVIEYGYPAVKSAENIQDVIPLLKASNTMTKEERRKRLPVFYDSRTNFLDHNSICQLSGINRHLLRRPFKIGTYSNNASGADCVKTAVLRKSRASLAFI
jgi:hypothetical protein